MCDHDRDEGRLGRGSLKGTIDFGLGKKPIRTEFGGGTDSSEGKTWVGGEALGVTEQTDSGMDTSMGNKKEGERAVAHERGNGRESLGLL